ncbi:MAG: hypothetical protein QME96_15100 [Myxococcota bacterium]|nr:hypothetical protein [Myxococcota bacterium]
MRNRSQGLDGWPAVVRMGEQPTIGPLLMLDASLEVTRRLLLYLHPEIQQLDGPELDQDDPPLPWMAGPILDQIEALRRSIDRYRCVVVQGGNCCLRCPGWGRTRPLPPTPHDQEQPDETATKTTW